MKALTLLVAMFAFANTSARGESENPTEPPSTAHVGESIGFAVPTDTLSADVIILCNLKPIKQTSFRVKDGALTLVPQTEGKYLLFVRNNDEVRKHQINIKAKPKVSPRLTNEVEMIEQRIKSLEEELENLRQLHRQLQKAISPQRVKEG